MRRILATTAQRLAQATSAQTTVTVVPLPAGTTRADLVPDLTQTLKIWLTTLFAGGMLGIGFGALRELLDELDRDRGPR